MNPLRPLVPMLLLSLVSLDGVAQAGPWTKVRSGPVNVFYLDKTSIAEAEGGRKAWSLRSYGKPQQSADDKTYRSVKALHLYDCQQRTATLMSQAFYPEAMAKGEAIGTFKYEQYDAEPIAAGSHADSALKLVCAKKIN